MAQIKYSKFKHFKIVTGAHFLDLISKAKDASGEKQINALETLTLGLYLMDTLDLLEAQKEFKRLINNDEKYDIIDNVDPFELMEDFIN